jgi:replicative DNA helicase
MKLSAPVYHLKRKARRLSRERSIALHDALDRIAAEEGYGAWSLLAARHAQSSPASRIFPLIAPGDLLLIAARPGHGKTLMAIELAIQAMKAGRASYFFTLDYTEKDVVGAFRSLNEDPARYDGTFMLDCSDHIDSTHIIQTLNKAPAGTYVGIDYLQLLDQRRDSPPLSAQIAQLSAFANERKLSLAFVSQIDRRYDPSRASYPGIADIRLPNPVDLSMFRKTCFLQDGEVHFQIHA